MFLILFGFFIGAPLGLAAQMWPTEEENSLINEPTTEEKVVPLITNGEQLDNEKVITKYKHKERPYEIDFPMEWEIVENLLESDVIALNPLQSDQDAFQENINVMVDELDPDEKFDTYFNKGLENLKRYLTGFTLLDQGEMTIHEMPAFWSIYKFTLGNLEAQVMQFSIKGTDGKVYLITCSSTQQDFESYRDTFDTIAKSFRLK